MFNTGNCASVPLVASLDGGNGGNGGNGMWGDGGWWVLIILFALIFGWGNGGWGGNGGGQGAVGGMLTRSDLCQDMSFSQLENSVRGIADGICSLGYDQLNRFNDINTNLAAGFAGVNNAVCTLGYQNAQLINGLGTQVMDGFNSSNVVALQNANAIQTQLAECCCNTREAIQANTTQGVLNTNAIQNQIQQCCCANEKDLMQLNYNLATQNCSTLQAIDKVGDRIIDYLAADKAQALRDENQALRLAASQQAQNNYLISQLMPVAKPAYITCSPYASAFGYPYGYGQVNYNNGGCGCGCGCA